MDQHQAQDQADQPDPLDIVIEDRDSDSEEEEEAEEPIDLGEILESGNEIATDLPNHFRLVNKRRRCRAIVG